MDGARIGCERRRPGAGSHPALIVPFVLALLFPGTARAQEAGTVTGQVLDQSGSPVGSAQVYLPEQDLGSLTQANGRYVILNVPAGTHEVRVERIGFEATSNQVSVGTGESVALDFTLAQEVLGLDEIVVTGTAGQARRREIGNTIAQLNLEDEVVANPVNMDGLLQGRVPGLQVQLNSGQVGDGGKIRLRGNVSAALSNQPLIYIDGVRVQSEPYPNLSPTTLGQQYSTFVTASPLNDLNPADIERVEVIKGAAATTLYGTEAASGVIQIFTKRGTTGEPVWEATIEQGLTDPNPYGVRRTLRGTAVESFPQFVNEAGGHANYMFHDPWLRNGHHQTYALSVRGSTSPISYFLSGQFEDQEDIFVTAGAQSYAVRGNLGIDLTESVGIDWNAAYNTRDIENVSCGNNVHGICLQAARAPQNYIASAQFEDLNRLVTERDDLTQIDRLITGGTLRYQPASNFSNRLIFGYDRAAMTGRIVLPYDHIMVAEGYASTITNVEELVTLDFVSNYGIDLSSDFSADVSAGFQRVTRDESRVEGWTEGFPGPGNVTLSSGSVSLARESRERVITGGVFGQVVVGFQDKLFVTGGTRVDGNSAFGQDFGWAVYPKVSGSWIVSDEEFWPEALGQTKLRGAWGTAGRAPGAFDAVRTWSPIPWGNESAFVPLNVGNSDLGPEKTTEIELGFENSTLDDRLTVDFTWYRQITSDALMPVRQIPSEGDWGSQLENVGKIKNTGVELAVTGRIVDGRDWGWDLGMGLSTNHSEVLDLGGAPSFSAGGGGYIAEGQPVPVIRGTRFLNPDEIGEPLVEEDHYFGPNVPTMILTPRTTVEMPYGILFTARGEFQGGHYIRDGASRWALATGAAHPSCWDAIPLIDQGRTEELTVKERMWCLRENLNSDHFVYPADFFKLREVSVRIPIDEVVPRASSASVTLSAQNVFRWLNDDFEAWDPESAGGFSVGQSFTNDIWENPAPAKRFSAAFRVRF